MTLGDIEDTHLFIWPMYINTERRGEPEKFDYIPSSCRDVEVQYLYPFFTIENEQMPNVTVKPALFAIVNDAQWRKARGTK